MAMLEIRGSTSVHVKVSMDTDCLVIGRAEPCDVVVPEAGVNQTHACIRRSEGHYYLENLAPSNGLLVNGKPVAGRQLLEDGDVITIASYQIGVNLGQDSPPPTYKGLSLAEWARQSFTEEELAAELRELRTSGGL